MKNSIEEDIKDIEKYISFTSKRENFSHDTDWNWNKDLANKIEHILSDYKRVLKENEELNKKIKEQKECAFREDGTEECLWYCSNCHDEWLFYEGTPEENNLKYCPHCGAKVIKYESYIETEIEIANKMAKDYLKESEE